MSEPEWYRQQGLACEYCGAPGHLIPLPEPVNLVYTTDLDVLSAPALETAVTCPEHRFLVRSRHERLKDERRFAERDHGRPVLDDEPYPEQVKRSVGTILRRLKGWDGPLDGR